MRRLPCLPALLATSLCRASGLLSRAAYAVRNRWPETEADLMTEADDLAMSAGGIRAEARESAFVEVRNEIERRARLLDTPGEDAQDIARELRDLANRFPVGHWAYIEPPAGVDCNEEWN